jgi:death-on-curing protein
MIKKHGGSSGVRDMGMLESAVHRPFATYANEDLYPDLYLKAGALIQSIIKNHPFIDGNKRTAFVGAFTLLRRNLVRLDVSEIEAVKFMLKVANNNLSVDEISTWLKKHSKEI